MKRPISVRIFRCLQAASRRCLGICGVGFMLIWCTRSGLAQTTDSLAARGFQQQKIFVGGSLGLSIGTYSYLGINPLVGYRFNSVFAAGIALNAQYNATRYYQANNTVNERDHFGLLGGGIFGRVYPIPQLFIHIQPEWDASFGTSIYYDGRPDQKYRVQTSSMLLGAGYARQVGTSSFATLMLLYDVLQNPESPYGNQPLLRAGFEVGL